MMLKARHGIKIISEHIESIDRPYGLQPFHEVTMTSGAKHAIAPDELRKAFPNYQ